MARDSSGSHNEPIYAGTGAPSDAADLTEVAAFAKFVGNLKVGPTNGTATGPGGSNTGRATSSGADVWEGLFWWDTTVNALFRYLSGAWVQVVEPHSDSRLRVFGTINTFTNQTTYADFPIAADKNALDMSFTKFASASKLVVRIFTSASLTSGNQQNMYVGVNIGGTDYDVAHTNFPIATNRQRIDGEAVISGLAAGTYAIKPRFRAQSASVMNFAANDDRLYYTVTETN